MAALVSSETISLRAPAWLARSEHADHVRVLDVRPHALYARGHVPGAVHAPARTLLFDRRGALLSAGEVALAMSNLGVGDEHTIVLVDDARSEDARATARALARYGHYDVHVLDGGFNRWRAEGRPVSITPVAYPAASFTARVA
jgi:3-mercaptopyruvate sulfurtransferase SseA